MLLFLLLAACGGRAGPAQPSQLRKAVLARPSTAMTSFHGAIARDQGFFVRNGLDMTVQQMQSPAAMAAMQAGEVQFATSTGTATRSAVEGLAVRVLGYIQTEPFSLVTKPDVASIAALKGQKVGFSAIGGDDYLYTLAALKKGQLSASDVQALPVGASTQIAQALIAGQIDAGVLSPPFTQQLVEKGFHVHTGPDIVNLPSSGLASSVQVLQKSPELVRTTLDEVLDAIVWARSRPNDAIDYFAKAYDLSPTVAKAAYEQQMAALHFSWSQDELEGAVQRAVEEAKSNKKPAFADIYDMTTFNELVKAKGLG